jgi:hypothetical protein
MFYTVHSPVGPIACATLRLAAKVRRALGGHVVASN